MQLLYSRIVHLGRILTKDLSYLGQLQLHMHILRRWIWWHTSWILLTRHRHTRANIRFVIYYQIFLSLHLNNSRLFQFCQAIWRTKLQSTYNFHICECSAALYFALILFQFIVLVFVCVWIVQCIYACVRLSMQCARSVHYKIINESTWAMNARQI